jgi:ABC-type Fe3+/spermidine/putrescine transport system ATPase subunit
MHGPTTDRDALELAGLERSYPGFHLGPVDLDVGPEVLAVLGPSGCGKTTLLSLVAGHVAPDAGSVALDGRPLDGRPPEDRGVGLVFQDGALFPHMTARENVAYPGASPARVETLAETLEVADVLDRPATALSGGERQRVALARALAADPDALLLDEPLSNLDAPIRRRLRTQLDGVFDDLGVPVVVVTHDQRAAAALADRVAVMHDGDVVQAGTVDAVLDRPATPFVARFVGANVLPGALVDRESRVAIRPEHVEFGGDHPATVRAVHREGAASRVTVVLSSTEDTDAHAGTPDTDAHAGTPDTVVDAFAADPPAVGETVGVALPDDHLVALGEQG